MNIQGFDRLEFCSVIVIREGVVFSNELIVGTNHDAVAKQAEKRFVERLKEQLNQECFDKFENENINIALENENIQSALKEGYWQDTLDSSVCISWADVLTNNILE